MCHQNRICIIGQIFLSERQPFGNSWILRMRELRNLYSKFTCIKSISDIGKPEIFRISSCTMKENDIFHCLHCYITKILCCSIFCILVNCIFDSQESYKRSIPSPRRDISSDIFVDKRFVELEYFIHFPSFENLSHNCCTSCSYDGHISIKGKCGEFSIF